MAGTYRYEEEYLVAVSGAVWVDENEDGIRQPSEPVLPGEEISIHVSSRHYSRLAGTVTADEQGLYLYPETHAGADFTLVTRQRGPRILWLRAVLCSRGGLPS